MTTLLLSIFVGALGVDRFYTGQVGLGIGKLLVTIFTCGYAGWIWWLIDVIQSLLVLTVTSKEDL